MTSGGGKEDVNRSTMEAFRYAAKGDREKFQEVIRHFPEEDKAFAQSFAEEIVFEERRQRALPKREFPFWTWNSEIRAVLERLFGTTEPDKAPPSPWRE
jgi:hypothetical protein